MGARFASTVLWIFSSTSFSFMGLSLSLSPLFFSLPLFVFSVSFPSYSFFLFFSRFCLPEVFLLSILPFLFFSSSSFACYPPFFSPSLDVIAFSFSSFSRFSPSYRSVTRTLGQMPPPTVTVFVSALLYILFLLACVLVWLLLFCGAGSASASSSPSSSSPPTCETEPYHPPSIEEQFPLLPQLLPSRIQEDVNVKEIDDTRKVKLPDLDPKLVTDNQVFNHAWKRIASATNDHLDSVNKNKKLCSKPVCDLPPQEDLSIS